MEDDNLDKKQNQENPKAKNAGVCNADADEVKDMMLLNAINEETIPDEKPNHKKTNKTTSP